MGGKEVIGICPKCGGSVLCTGKVYACSSNRSRKNEEGAFERVAGCGFVITPIGGKLISRDQAEKLIALGKTDEQEFESRWSNKKYRAHLILNAENLPRLFIVKDPSRKSRDPFKKYRQN